MDVYEFLSNYFILLSSFAWVCCPTGILGGFVVIVFFTVFRSSQKPQAEAWSRLANQTDLIYKPGTYTRRPSLSGSFRGRATDLYTIRRGTARRKRTYTIISMVVDVPGVFLSITGEGLFSEISKSMGMQDIQITDKEFDQRFVIKSQPETFAEELFREAGLRRHLLQAQNVSLKLKDGQLVYEKMLIDTDVNNLMFLLDLMNHLSEACERHKVLPVTNS